MSEISGEFFHELINSAQSTCYDRPAPLEGKGADWL